jgi:hypothetical protein
VTRERAEDRVFWRCVLRFGVRVFSLRAAFQSDSVDFSFFLFWLLLQFTVYKSRKAQK